MAHNVAASSMLSAERLKLVLLYQEGEISTDCIHWYSLHYKKCLLKIIHNISINLNNQNFIINCINYVIILSFKKKNVFSILSYFISCKIHFNFG